MALKIEELRSAIESYPRRLYEALEAVDKAERAVERINEQIEEEEASLSLIEHADDSDEQSGESIQETLIQIDHELALLEVRCEQTKGRLELEYRRNPPQGDKVTEATVSAFVKSHPQFLEAKEGCLNKKFERETANLTRRAGYVSTMAERRITRDSSLPITSPKLTKLQERLMMAESGVAGVEMRLEEVKASILPYQMLVQLYTAGLIQ